MKKQIYSSPATVAYSVRFTSTLCGSNGDRITSNIGIKGGDNSGDVNNAF